MTDTIFSVRIDDETKSKFNIMAKEMGINNKEFMEELISLYELNNSSKNSDLDVQSDISELQNISKRIVDIYINLIERSNILKNKNAAELDIIIKNKNHEIEKIKKELENEKSKQEKLTEKIKILEENNKDLLNKLKDEGEGNENIKSLNKMLEEKVNLLESKILDYINIEKELSTKNKNYKDLEEERNRLIQLTDEYKNNNEDLKIQLEKEQKSAINKEVSLKEDFKREIEFLKQKEDLEKNKEILHLKELNYEKISLLQKDFNDKIIELISLNNKYEEEIKELNKKLKNK